VCAARGMWTSPAPGAMPSRVARYNGAVQQPWEPKASLVVAGSAVLVAVVAYLDFVTGIELRVFPLYFMPVLAIAMRFGRWPGLAASAVCAGVWDLSNHLAGMRGSQLAVGVVNLAVMTIAFASVALLGATQRRWLQREKALSRTDSLTGLLNGRGFYEAAAAELARSSRYRHPVTLAYFDLDDFKQVNDRFGHARGDAVLVDFARALRRWCRSTDVVGRVGGDEFVVLLPETGRDTAEAALVKLRARAQEAASQHGLVVTASVGSVSCASPPAAVEALVHDADRAMYAVKVAGKNELRCLEAADGAGISPA
jgi:diguanylate cyclase (GGDEF)-like protein